MLISNVHVMSSELEDVTAKRTAAQFLHTGEALAMSGFVVALRERLLLSLQELAVARALLEENRIPHDAEFGCQPSDHADVLIGDITSPQLSSTSTGGEVVPGNASEMGQLAPQSPENDVTAETVLQFEQRDSMNTLSDCTDTIDAAATMVEPITEASTTSVCSNTQTRSLELGEDLHPEAAQDLECRAVASDSVAPRADIEQLAELARRLEAANACAEAAEERARVAEAEARRMAEERHGAPEAHARSTKEIHASAGRGGGSSERLEVELSMAKALLMLSNVSLDMDFDRDGPIDISAAQVIKLKGNRHLIQLLITLKQKVALLNQQYLLLRGDMLYLNHEMQVCRQWVLQSLRSAMQHQSQEHSSLQTRFERLSKVLN